jgi:hypothetical protein
MPLDTPAYNAIPFAQDGLKNTIPNSTASEGAASFTQGFPPETMNPINAGGVPPAGRDMNGILNQLSSHQVWLNAGMIYKFDATLATAIGGYKTGAIIQTDDGLSAYICVTNNNSNNPNSVLTGWMPYAGQALINYIGGGERLRQYAVGDIYFTTQVFADADAVAGYFGGGEWEAWGGGTYMSMAGTNTGVTLTGNTVSGTHEKVITIDQMPAHNHDIAIVAGGGVVDITGADNRRYVEGGDIVGATNQTGASQPFNLNPRTTTSYAWLRTA